MLTIETKECNLKLFENIMEIFKYNSEIINTYALLYDISSHKSCGCLKVNYFGTEYAKYIDYKKF